MNESYAEAGCKRKEGVSTYLIRAGLVIACLLLFIVGLQSQILLIVAAILIVAIFYVVFPMLKVEYEYVFCDGQLDFDRIMGGQKRKTMKRIDFEQVEICAPLKSHALDGYTYSDLKTVDFSSRDKEKKQYAIIVRNQGAVTKIIFEPSEKMLECIKYKAPRKLVME